MPAANSPVPITPVPITLTIAGSDSSGGAGIQADLKTFAALGVYGASAIAAMTAQNTLGVQAIHVAPADFVETQIASVLSDLDVAAIKIGMLGDRAMVEAVARALERWPRRPVVLDPVMVATTGAALLTDDAVEALVAELFPVAILITPNLHEAARLLGAGTPLAGSVAAMQEQGQALLQRGAAAVLVKGGHGASPLATDVLVDRSGATSFSTARLDTSNTHGTGCTLSSAITALLAKGYGLADAVELGKAFLAASLASADGLGVGHGNGPVDHLAGGDWWRGHLATGSGQSGVARVDLKRQAAGA